MLAHRFAVVALAALLSAAAQAPNQGSTRPPVRARFPPELRAPRISFLSVEFQKLYFGREGPGYTKLKEEPSKGASQVLEITLSGQEQIAAVRFDMVDESGASIGPVPAMKPDYSSEWGNYVGLAGVPFQPFRIMASGRDLKGNTFRQVHSRLFRPQENPPPQALLPPDMPAEHRQRMEQMVAEFDRDSRAQIDKQARAYADGYIVLPRTQVTGLTYEPFYSANGNVLGLRLRYRMQFSSDGLYQVMPHVFPVYSNWNWRSVVTMKVHAGSIDPQPELTRPGEMQDITVWGGHGRFKGGVPYRFVVDLIPDYVIFNAERTRTCIYSQKFQTSPTARSAWDGIRASAAPVKYKVDISTAHFDGEIDGAPNQRTLYENFLREGAQDCGPEPNIHF